MNFDTKIKIVLSDDLETWQKLNVTAFLMSGIAGTQNIIGEAYEDQNGTRYLPMSQQPIMIHAADKDQLHELLQKVVTKDLAISIYTRDLFETYNDEDNRAAVKAVATEALDIVGIGIRGKKNLVDKLLKNYPLHP